MVVGGKPMPGTNYAFRFATVNIVSKGRRFMLYTVPVSVGTKKVDVVAELLAYAKGKVRIRKVYMDRGFFTSSVIDYLNRNRIKFLMPAVRNWRIKRLMESVETPYVTDYKMKADWMNVTTMFKLIVVTMEDGNRYIFATNTEITKFGAVTIGQEYKRRWGIETAYRVKESFRARTTSKNYIIRLFSVTLYNMWVIINALLSVFLFGKLIEKPIVTAKMTGMLLIMNRIP